MLPAISGDLFTIRLITYASVRLIHCALFALLDIPSLVPSASVEGGSFFCVSPLTSWWSYWNSPGKGTELTTQQLGFQLVNRSVALEVVVEMRVVKF